MYRSLQQRLISAIQAFLRQKYDVHLPTLVVDAPPKVEMGEYALPFSFELAKRLRKAPRKIAEEVATELPPIEGFEKPEVAGAGYINFRLKRGDAATALAKGESTPVTHDGKILVEHTSINPNKAAHIGHLRNSILGDTFVRLLRAAGRTVDIQNYIDNTGVQVADVVVGFTHIENKSKAEITALTEQPKFDYYCWDLYAHTSQWYEQAAENKKIRLEVLHAIEHGGNELSEIAEIISRAVLRRHLETMDRLGIEYDFLPRESEILRLNFWALAFEQLKEKGVLYFETEGKNKGCWVMTRPGRERVDGQPDEDAKVIVRSNGTVGYVGKDIAYHLWKFGLLGRDFGYKKFYLYPNGQQVWISCDPAEGESDHPHFGGVSEIYNVIDTRQSDPQETVKEAIRLLGYNDKADHYTHFSYEMVALTPRCAIDLGYDVSEDDRAKSYIEVSGRKGFGVKADDLIDKLIDAATKEVDSRHPELTESERREIGTQIAIGALRYFMLKYTKASVIAFDFKEALAFEGETGPYAQYAVVRATNIFRKAGIAPGDALAYNVDFTKHFAETAEIWEVWLMAGKTSQILELCISQSEPAYAAKHAFQLAQLFNNFYHRHHILTEEDEGRKKFLLATAAVMRRELIAVLAAMGISVPPVM
ncbi:arginyl-tRNA synthetase [Candidatus Koribacter versatilis Ellin345]|uniref:arginine--tRNA ligase n=1 Tax=Koribacter versatilis (strain Ellin345) TaxID=204669 RepID=Q1IQ17_KORVE|nr:arginine--tRNA ligase [Candidatus Koribacter versatilis]ABF41033.1 arginyl-tRNA synthetase [Candidatus Koribacter versatilis Ellin345]